MDNMELINFRTDKSQIKELTELQHLENLDKSTAARKAFELGINEWKRQEALSLISQGKISIGKASEFLAIPIYQVLELIKERKTTFISITDDELDKQVIAVKRK